MYLTNPYEPAFTRRLVLAVIFKVNLECEDATCKAELALTVYGQHISLNISCF